MAVDQIHRGLDSTIRPRLDHPEVAEAIKHGDIHKILQALPSGVTRADIEDYLKQRGVVFQQGLLQNVQIKADEASLPPPDFVKNVLPIDDANALTDDDRDLLADYFGGSSKAAVSAKAAPEATDADKADAESQAFGQGLLETVEERTKHREEFLFELEQAAFNLQLTNELQSKRDELREELRRIFRLVKERKIAPEFAIVALTKTQVMEAGLIMTVQGKQLMNVNDQQRRVAESIQGLDAGNVGDFEMKKHEMSSLGMDMQRIMQNIQTAMQKVSTADGTGKSMLDDYMRTRADLLRNVIPKG